MATFKNEFSWSLSRNELFHYCPRKYFYNYYEYWDGWLWNATPLKKKIYQLKKMSALDMWLGDVVHRCIKFSILHKDKEAPFLLESLQKRLAHDLALSLKNAQGPIQPKNLLLLEHYKGLPVDEHYWFEKGAALLNAYMQSTWYERLKTISANQFLYIDADDIKSMQFDVNGLRVYAIPDLCFYNSDGQLVLIDWKTGKERHTALSPQLKIYALRLQLVDGIKPSDKSIQAYTHYIQTGTDVGRLIEEADIDEAYAIIEAGKQQMLALLDNEAENIPKPMAYFEKTEDTSKCALCPFQEICN